MSLSLLLKRVYIGQSKNVPSRIRNHKMNLRNGNYEGKTKGLDNMQLDWNCNKDDFRFSQICSCKERDLLEEETYWLKKYLDEGWEVYNHFVNTSVTGLICPDEFKSVIERVIKMLDKGRLSVGELSSSLDSIELR